MRLQFSLALLPKFSESMLDMIAVARYEKRKTLFFPSASYFVGSLSEHIASPFLQVTSDVQGLVCHLA
jgi:hypothetical protein